MAQQATPNSKHDGRLLIADDDTDMRLLLAEYFRRLGYQVEERESGMAALEATLTGRFDCFIFDVSMPGMSGIELLKRVRDRGIQTPALFLTAHDALDDKVAGFEAGADDYLAKPFSPRTLLARIRAMLRRSGLEREARVESGDLVLDPERQSVVVKGGEPVRLTGLEFRLLQFLLANAGHALPTERLTSHVWGDRGTGDRQLLKQLVRRLRQKIENDPADPRYLTTVSGVGYLFKASAPN